MEKNLYTITTELKNIKSHYGVNQVKFEAIKPITVIAGPNGEGKSNLIEGVLFGLGNYIGRSPKLKKSSSFFKKVVISESPLIKTTFNEIIFSDLIKRGLYSKKSEINLPERFLPIEMISYKKNQGEISTTIKRISNRYDGTIGKSIVRVNKSEYDANIEKNSLEHLDLIYLNTDNILYDFFVKYLGQFYTEEINKIQGNRGQSEYFNQILNYFPEENDRLIQDVESGRFEEKYYKGKFITSSLPTGAKKECILYVLGILREIHQNKKDWLSVIIIDEFEAGLHINRQKKIIDALTSAVDNDDVLKNHLKIILSTHSPVIFSELQKHPEIVDIYFVLREKNNPSFVYKQRENVENQDLIEKRILSELGLNVYELPSKILFVEGPTDKLFFEEVFMDVFIQPFYTCNINRMVRDFISSFPIVRSKEYKVLVDKNGLKQINQHVNKIQEDTELNISFKVGDIGCNSMEEFLFDIDISGGSQVASIWNKIERKIEHWNIILEDDEKINIDISSVRKKLEPNGRDGLRIFLQQNIKKNKKIHHLYSFIGSRFRELLGEQNIKTISDFRKKANLKFK